MYIRRYLFVFTSLIHEGMGSNKEQNWIWRQWNCLYSLYVLEFCILYITFYRILWNFMGWLYILYTWKWRYVPTIFLSTLRYVASSHTSTVESLSVRENNLTIHWAKRHSEYHKYMSITSWFEVIDRCHTLFEMFRFACTRILCRYRMCKRKLKNIIISRLCSHFASHLRNDLLYTWEQV